MKPVARTTGSMIVSMTAAAWRWQDARIRVGAHPAGVWSLVAIEDALVILRGFQRHAAFAVAQNDEADFFAFQKLFNHHRVGQRWIAPPRLLPRSAR